ncbi:cation diffusion facilitator family transporter [Homoserinibacter sp. YIM 151385]|uniref:cation diffusion facilitator family transporter n=1 Tax=Homoserinibacter sp. YIM 151385 TaxID=2985506 RepID=UPI0022F0CD3E|nr:cation diffusion facilitator family transporter [Homoserinibacter sp. YIM 151385]WBU37020.1 cation diffusion facilitator family transporter [Homoserinibacter sp. YIM 151385]
MRAEPGARIGRTELPDEQRDALRLAVRLEWASIAFLAVTVVIVALVLGSSQAMRAAWIEDLLSFLPPIAFLAARLVVRRRPDQRHPYGYHRATGIAHLVAAVSLLVMGAYLIVDSGSKLLAAEHPAIGGVTLFGETIWLGWLMIPAMALTIPAPVILGRKKMRLAETLHDKVLYADADMNKADWMTAGAAIVGVLGIGVGLWWADAAAALVIAASIARDGWKNLRRAVSALMDSRAKTFDDAEPHPLGREIDKTLRAIDWVGDAASRVRDEGHVFHVESFVIPAGGRMPTLAQLEAARERCVELDWKVQDMVIAPVAELPEELSRGSR